MPRIRSVDMQERAHPSSRPSKFETLMASAQNFAHPVVLSGGSGTRLWPMSRTQHPKQLLALLGEHSLLRQTVQRVSCHKGFAPPLIVSNDEHRFLIAEQLREAGI